jgi:hypothetical protein
MSYDTIKNHIETRLQGLGYSKSNSAFNFDDASARELNHRFVVLPVSGSVDPYGENLNTRLYDNQEWVVSIAYSKSTHNDIINRDEMLRGVEGIIKDIDNPDNYAGTIRLISYQSWEVEEENNYFIVRISFTIQDQYNY